MTTANPPENPETAPIEDVRLGSRLYLAIRYAHLNWRLFTPLILTILSLDLLARQRQNQAANHRNEPSVKFGDEYAI